MGSLPPMFSDFNIKKYKIIKYPSDISLQTLNEIKSLQTKRMDVAYSDKYDDINKSFKRLFNNRTREYPEELVNDFSNKSYIFKAQYNNTLDSLCYDLIPSEEGNIHIHKNQNFKY